MEFNFENKLTDSLEDYMEVISYICRRKVSARVSDIAMYLGVKMSSVTRALQCLSKEGLINYTKYKRVLMTNKGCEYADFILKRHRLSYDFLHLVLGLDVDSADMAAKKMKKSLNSEVIQKMQVFLNRYKQNNSDEYSNYESDGKKFCSMPSDFEQKPVNVEQKPATVMIS